MFWARFITSNTREMGYENHPTRTHPTRAQAQSRTHCPSGRDTVLATRQDTLGLTPTLGSRSPRRGDVARVGELLDLYLTRTEARSSHWV